ncbi:MAG: peptide chain release factor N(5)-glutamine methyltransferase [Nitrospirota bacterium]
MLRITIVIPACPKSFFITSKMRALDKLRKAKELLERHGIDNAIREAELIISYCMNLGRVAIYRDNPEVPKEMNSNIDKLLKRRIRREPLQYILGYTGFYGLKIMVGPGVLIPRPETELLVEEAIQIISKSEIQNSNFEFLDLCTGSGCVALALARKFPDARVYGTDISDRAIAYAARNAEINGITNVIFKQGSLFEPVRDLQFDLIASNPPYIKRNYLEKLEPEVRDWEPVEALDGGEDGLDYHRVIIPEAKNYLKDGGVLIIELGENQSDAVAKLAEESGFLEINLIKDYAGIERILRAKVNF